MDLFSFVAGFGACLISGCIVVLIFFLVATKAANDLGDWPEADERVGV